MRTIGPAAGSGRDFRTKVLFVCAKNRVRSLTAERMFAGSPHYDVKSRGVARDARIRLTERDVVWADLIFVMEKDHKNRIEEDFGDAVSGKRIECLFIDDVYGPMDEALMDELRRKLAPRLHLPEKPGPRSGAPPPSASRRRSRPLKA